jgi:hypothetical protein
MEKERIFHLEFIQDEIKRKNLRWQAAETEFTKMSAGEFRRRLGLRLPGARMRKRIQKSIARALRAAAPSYPAFFDWRNQNGQDWMSHIRDQGDCGSCVAFGVVATIEAQTKILKNDPATDLDLSEAHLFFCGGSCGCSTGWTVPPALTYAQDHGISTESCFPYQDHDMECTLCNGWVEQAERVKKWQEIAGVADRKNLISSHGPLVGCMDVYDDFRAYAGGVYQHTTGDKLGGHCICIVGYDDAQGCWICKNSWGTAWGETGGLSAERGWFRIAYGECGIDTDYPAYVIDDMLEGGIQDGEDQGSAPCCLSTIAKGTPYEQDLGLLKEFRDTNLLKSETAIKYMDLYYNYVDAFVEVLSTDKRSRELAFELLDTVIKAIKATGTPSEFKLTEDHVKHAMELVKRISIYGPAELQHELASYHDELNDLFAKGRGKKLTEFVRILQRHPAKARPKTRARKSRGGRSSKG